jgi:hypothetical protein
MYEFEQSETFLLIIANTEVAEAENENGITEQHRVS